MRNNHLIIGQRIAKLWKNDDLMPEEAIRPDNRMPQVRSAMQAPQQDGGIGASGNHMLHVRPEVKRIDPASVTAIAGQNDRVLIV
jgi:hypothetical protein